MSIQRFQFATEINRPAGEVFRWHERPGALERLTPPWEQIEILKAAQGVTDGQRVRLKQKVGPFWTQWEVEHREYVEGKQFSDVALRSPFSRWEHTHRVIMTGSCSCRLEDEITYQLPGGPLGRLLAGKWTRSKLQQLFAFRHEQTAADLNATAPYGAVRPMQFLVAGGSGFVGSALIPFLRSQGHEVLHLVRRKSAGPDEVYWDPLRGELDLQRYKAIDAVINLSGAPIARRWSSTVRDEIWNSRIVGTRTLVNALGKLRHRPFVVVSASGVGAYGACGNQKVDERHPRGSGFLADVCDAWEREVEAVDELGIRPVMLRTGMVLSPKGGALGPMLPLYKAGLGGPIGRGDQWVSWITLDDLLGVYYHAVLDQRCVHEVNAVAPQPVTQREFSETLAQILARRAWLTAPRPVLRAALGQMGDELLLTSTRAIPTVLEEAGYVFRHPELEPALRFLLGKGEAPCPSPRASSGMSRASA